ncbi:MAG: hotdog fold thioesterase [Verrucomicrobia bacterium]|nr:hotdog fold thioesterase [Cytophagales bacterium]
MFRKDASVELLNQRSQNTLVSHLAIEFLEVGEDFVLARMPVDHRTVQPLRLLHGGASVAFAETLGSMAAFLCIDEETHYCLGLEINANHLRAVPETGWVFGKATPVHTGRKTHVWEIKITNEQGKIVCISRITIMVMEK